MLCAEDILTITTDHTREYSLLLTYGKTAKQGVDLGTGQSLSDIRQTIVENLGSEISDGVSFWAEGLYSEKIV